MLSRLEGATVSTDLSGLVSFDQPNLLKLIGY